MPITSATSESIGISIAPTDRDPGTSTDIDFYTAPRTRTYTPPQMKTFRGEGPAPKLIFGAENNVANSQDPRFDEGESQLTL